jgi:hypothetical protein
MRLLIFPLMIWPINESEMEMKINAHFRLLMTQHLSVVVLSLQLSTKHPYLIARASCGLLSPIRRVCACKVCDK